MIDNESRSADDPWFDLAGFLRRRSLLIAIAVIAAVAGALILTGLPSERYVTTAQLLVQTLGTDDTAFREQATPDPAREANNQLALLQSDQVAEVAAEALGDGVSDDQVTDDVEVVALLNSDLFEIEATSSTALLAAQVANQLGEAFIELSRQRERARYADALQSVRADLTALAPEQRTGSEGDALRTQLARLTALRSLQTGSARLVKRALPPAQAEAKQFARNGVVGGILGLVAGFALALLLDRMDRGLRDGRSLAAAAGAPQLATIARSAALATGPHASLAALPDRDAEVFRLLRGRLRHLPGGAPASVLVTSPGAGEGKSTVATYLAAASAEAGVATLLVDGDGRRGTVSGTLGAGDMHAGLADLLAGQASFEEARQRLDTTLGDRGFSLLGAGGSGPNLGLLLEGEAERGRLSELIASHALTVVDAPPATAASETIPLMQAVDGVLIVAGLGDSTVADARSLRDHLDGLGVKVIGVVANFAPVEQVLSYGPRDY